MVIAVIYVHIKRVAASRHSFTLHLRTCVRLQVPLDEALSLWHGAPREIRKIMRNTADDIEDGCTLAASLGCRYACLPEWYVKMIEIGERNGNLADTLDRIIETDSRDEELRMSLFEKLCYPLLILTVLSYVSFLIFAFIIPRFNAMFSEMGARNIPLESLTSYSEAVVSYMPFAVIALWIMALLLIPMPYGPNLARPLRYFYQLWHSIRRFTPILGSHFKRSARARWAAMTGSLLKAGCLLPEAITEAARIESDIYFYEAAGQVAEAIRGGNPLSKALAERKLLSPAMIWQISTAGENLPAVLCTIGAREGKKISDYFDLWIQVATPLLTLAVGYLVAQVCVTLFGSLVSVIEGQLI